MQVETEFLCAHIQINIIHLYSKISFRWYPTRKYNNLESAEKCLKQLNENTITRVSNITAHYGLTDYKR